MHVIPLGRESESVDAEAPPRARAPLSRALRRIVAGGATAGTTEPREDASHDLLAAERRRIAQDLHDGLAQDLAFIVAYGERLAREQGEDHPVVIAARRALSVARGVMVDLEASHAPTAEAALREVADELAPRYDLEVSVHREAAHPEPRAAERRQIVRIAREAIANAARHGNARRVEVTLGAADSGTLLRIADDGRGMAHPTATPSTGFGLAAMRERAAAVGGELVTVAAPGGGTEVSVHTAAARPLAAAITD